MHIQIITFNLKDISEEEYRELAGGVAPAFVELPGLVSKSWLSNPATNTFGGVYIWRDREAMEAYKETEVYKAMMSTSNFDGVSVEDFSVLEKPSRITRGFVGT